MPVRALRFVCGRSKAVIALIILISFLYVLYLRSLLPSFQTFVSLIKRGPEAEYAVWPQYDPQPPFSVEWYNFNCLNGKRINKIERLQYNLKLWRNSTNPHCQYLHEKFLSIYVCEERVGSVVLPKSFQQKIINWFGQDPNAISLVRNQTVIHVYNRYTHQRSIHTPLRAKRPLSTKEQDGLEYVQKVAEETKSTCDFCRFESFTAQDTFGRLESNHSFTASNAFKMDKWHGLVVFKKHNFFHLTADEIVDVLQLAEKWFSMVHNIDESRVFPMLSWDNTAHAGASQFHPHLQAFIDSISYFGVMDNLRHAAQQYARNFIDSNYFTDVTSIHQLLGLSVQLRNATAIIELTERGDCEFVLMSLRPNPDLYLLLYYVIRTFVEELNIFSFSAGIAFPIMKEGRIPGNMPAMIRITARGAVNSTFSEISGFDLYLSPNTSKDPYALLESLNKVIRKYEGGLM